MILILDSMEAAIISITMMNHLETPQGKVGSRKNNELRKRVVNKIWVQSGGVAVYPEVEPETKIESDGNSS